MDASPPQYCSVDPDSPVPHPFVATLKSPEKVPRRDSFPVQEEKRESATPRVRQIKVTEISNKVLSPQSISSDNNRKLAISRSPIEISESDSAKSSRDRSNSRSGSSSKIKHRSTIQQNVASIDARKQKMKSLEDAAKARVQAKKSQEDEMRRLVSAIK